MGRKGVVGNCGTSPFWNGKQKKIQEPQSAYQMQTTFSTTLLQEASSSVPNLGQRKVKHAEKEGVLVYPL
jgi:hypothetical protein